MRVDWIGSRGDKATFSLTPSARVTPVFLDRNGKQWYQLEHWRGFLSWSVDLAEHRRITESAGYRGIYDG